ncbi:MAG: protein-L-isoaspartate(D-aspartate) O-methyltransferase [Gaiellales bacterium]
MSDNERREAMIRLLRRRGIDDEMVIGAMRSVPREAFVPQALHDAAYDDCALPIGHDQTISQPLMVAQMCELLAVGPGDRVLDIGLGSGYAAAVLAAMGCEVVGIEVVPELAERARAVLAALRFPVEVRIGDGRFGAPDRSPFDAISVAAAAPQVPEALVEQLADGGRLVMPVGEAWGQRLVRLTRVGEALRREELTPCVFVPLV